MTEKPKTPLFKSHLLLVIFLIISLLGFLAFESLYFKSAFTHYFILGLSFIVVFLIPLRQRIRKKESIIGLQVQDLHERSNLVEAEIQHEDHSIQSFQDQIVDYSKLKGLTERLGMCLYLEETIKTLSDEVNNLFGGDDRTVILYLFHSKTGELGISSSQKGEIQVNLKSKKGDIFDKWVVKSMQPLLVEDAKSDYRFDSDKIINEDIRDVGSLISVPMAVGNKAMGIIRIDCAQEDAFTTEDLRFLRTIGDLGGVAIENAQLYQRVERLAVRDGLTGLYLNRYLLEQMPIEITRQMRRKKELSFIMMDLDHFKQYNDKFGHVAGDIVLRTLGEMLSKFFSDAGDIVSRYGGEEFAVLLPDCSKKKAVELAEEIRKQVEQTDILLRREKTNITISVGVASFPSDATAKNEFIHKADSALYQAKEQGRNRVCAA